MSSRRMLVTAVALMGLALASDAVAAAPQEPPCREVLDQPEHGREAVSELGGGLAGAAALNDVSGTELREQLLQDHAIWLDECGSRFAVDPGVPPEAAAAVDAHTGAPPYPIAETFTLHTRPGSNRVMYLDFWGKGNITGTGWNASEGLSSFSAKRFTIDGDLQTWSQAEHAYIQQVWQWVAEDYAVFDIDVTTADPGQAAITRSGSGDQQYGTRVMFTGDNGWLSTCSCGGIAYLSAFNRTSSHAYYQPAWVYARPTGTAHSAAQAASHEAGHNLGLSHQGYVDGDGTVKNYYGGHGAWAPIMGVGYARPVSQWSRSEYKDASVQQDDLAIIPQYGAALLGDDHAATLGASATAIGGLPASPPGMITSGADVDTFRFTTGAAPVRLSAKPSAVGSNLDIALTLYDADGDLVAQHNPPASMVSNLLASGLDATIDRTLAAGTYYAQVRGSGHGDPLTTGYSNYASIGPYTLTAAAGLRITTDSLPQAEARSSYTAALTSDGGAGAVTWSASGLPGSLRLSKDGALSGTPANAGQPTVTVTATDAAGARNSKTFTLTILAPQPPRPTTPDTPPVTAGPSPEIADETDRRRGGVARSVVRYRGRAARMAVALTNGAARATVTDMRVPARHAVVFRLCLTAGGKTQCENTLVRAGRRAVTRALRPSRLAVSHEAVTATLTARAAGSARALRLGRVTLPA